MIFPATSRRWGVLRNLHCVGGADGSDLPVLHDDGTVVDVGPDDRNDPGARESDGLLLRTQHRRGAQHHETHYETDHRLLS